MPYPFHLKMLVSMRIQRRNPATGEWEEDNFYQNLVPWVSQATADPNLRMHNIVNAARWKFEIAEERGALPGSDWTVDGINWIEILLTPGLRNVPAPGVGGGANRVELPSSLTKQKGVWNPQVEGHCFQWCLRAAFLEIGSFEWKDRLHTVRCSGPPFYTGSRKRGRPGADDPRQLVDVGLDFAAVDTETVSVEVITAFELANLGIVEVVVYGWVERAHRGEKFVGEVLLRTPPEEVIRARTPDTRVVVLLLHQNHYALVYNFNAFVGQRGQEVGVRWRRGTHLHVCPICRSNYKSELALRNHFKTGQCRSDFEGRRSEISMPQESNSVLKYRTKPSCEMSPLIVYADFEVFSSGCEDEGGKALGRQNRVAAVGYAAVGMCGYEPPEEHRLCLIHAQPGEHECAVVLKLLVAMENLREHFRDWRINRRKALVWTPEQKAQHRTTRTCRECGRGFNYKKEGLGKVAHHDRGTGRFLASLCQDCNKAAHKPTRVTVAFHNGGHYDFHFVIRALAKLKHDAQRASIAKTGQEPQSSSGSNVGPPLRRKIRKFGVKELAAKVNKVSLRCLIDSMPTSAIKSLRESSISILQKSGETNLTIDFGGLRFIDTMNFCRSGLGKLIESHRHAVLKPSVLGDRSVVSGLEEAFPLTASRHPLLQSAGEDVWTALLKKLPMPWEFFRGCEAFSKPAVWPLPCYHSKLSGKCSEKDHAALTETSQFMGFRSFKDIFNAYLWLDVTAYADLMQIFRQHFFEMHHLDPFLYPTLPSAAWDAVLRDIVQRRGMHFSLITDIDIYADVKKAMMGGVCAVFRPHSELNFEGMEGYDAAKPAKSALYLDINSMYPHAMTKHLPCCGGSAVKLPDGEDAKLEWLHGILDAVDPLEDRRQDIYLLFVDYDFPEELHDGIDWPSPCRMEVPIEEVGPYTKDAVRGRKPTEKLVPFLGLHRCEGIHAKRLAFLRNHLGARVWKVHRAYSFQAWPILKPFMDRAYAYRQQLKNEGRDIEQGFAKLTKNSVYGKTVQNQEKFRNSTHYFDPLSFSRAQVDGNVADFDTEIFEEDAFLGTVRRVRSSASNVNRSPVQVGWAVLEESKLDLSIKYWAGIKAVLPRSVPILTDTDSVALEILGNIDPVPLLAEANLKLPVEFDLIGDVAVEKFEEAYGNMISPGAMAKLKELRGKLGALADECSAWKILSIVCLAVKKYSIRLTENRQIQKAKGVAKSVRESAKHDEYLRIHFENSVRYDTSVQLRSSSHQMLIEEATKKSFCVMNDKAFQLTREYCRPLGHWRNAYLGLWLKVECRDHIFKNILEFVRGPAPAKREEWGRPIRELMRKRLRG